MNKIFNKLFLGLAVCGLAMTACSDGVGAFSGSYRGCTSLYLC